MEIRGMSAPVLDGLAQLKHLFGIQRLPVLKGDATYMGYHGGWENQLCAFVGHHIAGLRGRKFILNEGENDPRLQYKRMLTFNAGGPS